MESAKNGRKVEDLTTRTFGRWTVLGFSHYDQGSRWMCRCACGSQKIVRRQALVNGESQSCGCLNREISSIKNTLKNGESSSNRLYSRYRSNANRKDREFTLSKEQFVQLTSSKCHYCNSSPDRIVKKTSVLGEDYTYNGIDRKDNNLGYTLENCVSCCTFCNQAKHTFPYDAFIAWIDRLITHNINKIR